MNYFLIYLFFLIITLNKYRHIHEQEIERLNTINLSLIENRRIAVEAYGDALKENIKLKNKQNNQQS